jgi:DNA-binding LytR/AlgR family response regulator
MDAILIIEPFPALAVKALEKYFQVHRVMHLYELRSVLQKQACLFVCCPVRIYHPRIGELLLTAKQAPKLVLVRTQLDKLEQLAEDNIPYWNLPYSAKTLQHIVASVKPQSLQDLQRIHVMENRRLQMIPVHHILLIKKIPPGQVMIHTTEGDHLINANLTTILQLLPENSMERISDQLAVPVNAVHKITQKGYAFRGGYIPIRDRYLKTRRKTYREELI